MPTEYELTHSLTHTAVDNLYGSVTRVVGTKVANKSAIKVSAGHWSPLLAKHSRTYACHDVEHPLETQRTSSTW